MVSAASVAAAVVATVAGVVVVSRITPTTVHLLEQNFSNENLVPIVFLFFFGSSTDSHEKSHDDDVSIVLMSH